MNIQNIIRLATSLLLATSSIGAVSTAEANQIFTATVFTHDEKGTPIADISFYITSVSKSGTMLHVWKKTGLDGKVKVQAYEDVTGIEFGEIEFRSVFKPRVIAPNETMEFILPGRVKRTVDVVSSGGLPLSNLWVQEWNRTSSECWRIEGNWCESTRWETNPPRQAKTDENGRAIISSFDLQYPRDSSRALIVLYSPFEGVQMYRYITEDEYNKTGVTKVLIDNVPSIEVVAPSSVQVSKTFEITGQLTEAPAASPSILRASYFYQARDILKKAQFETRLYSKNKWSPWKKIGTASVSAAGKTKLSNLKFTKGKYQIKISGLGYSLAGRTKTIEVMDGYPPAAPTSLSAKVSKTSVTLSWKAASVVGKNSARNYVIEYSKNNGVSWLKVTKPMSTSRSLTVKGLKSKTSYLFRVTAVNDVGNSKASKSLKVTTG